MDNIYCMLSYLRHGSKCFLCMYVCMNLFNIYNSPIGHLLNFSHFTTERIEACSDPTVMELLNYGAGI